MSIHLDVFPTGMFQANCVLLGDRSSGQLAVIDPGDEAERIVERVKDSGLKPTSILHTHAHLDHAGATAEVHRALGDHVPVGLHRDEVPLYRGLSQQAAMFGLSEVGTPPEPDLWLEHGQMVEIGSLRIEVRHTPGHSPGGVSFVIPGQRPTAIVGDALFAGSIGRTDLFGGSFEVLERSIREQLYTLPDSTRVVCGHGPDTTIGREKQTNPFVRVG
jgi:glyoxylase-like metal-dependent hydrolase (beta-lactamase superfamily II)